MALGSLAPLYLFSSGFEQCGDAARAHQHHHSSCNYRSLRLAPVELPYAGLMTSGRAKASGGLAVYSRLGIRKAMSG